jgi:hypothetical protein
MNIEMFLYTLPFMLKGMAAIFIVTLVLILSVVLLNKLTASKK